MTRQRLSSRPSAGDATGSKHSIRRRATRARLLNSARRLIGEGQFYACSLEDLCAMAGISRAAFYLHFPNKDAMLDVLQEEMGDWYLRQYKKLDAKTAASKAGVVEWLRNFVRGFGAAKHAIVLVTRQENGRERLRSQAVRRRGEAVLALGAQVPAFRLVGEDGRIDEERRIRLLLLIFQVEQLCQYLVFDAPSEGDFPLEVLAEEFVRFGGASAAQDATTMEGR